MVEQMFSFVDTRENGKFEKVRCIARDMQQISNV